ncbi:MAG TPA: glycosyltransferase 87 family protein [Solirubrobacterales bacterium]
MAGFAVAPVLVSHDVFSYLDYARLGVRHGLNPYVHPPAAAPGDPAFARVTWPHTTSAYGPLFTLATYPLAWLPVGIAIAALKAVAALSVLGLAALCGRLAAWRGEDPARAAVVVGLNPLVLVHVVGGAHNDGLTMLLAMLGVAALLAGRQAAGGAALLVAAAVKSFAAFVAPFALLGTVAEGRRPRSAGVDPDSKGWASRPLLRLLGGAVAAAVATCLVSWLAFGWEWLDALGLASRNQNHTSHLSIPTTFARISGLGPGGVRVAALALFAALLAYLLARVWRGADWVRAAAWAGFGLLLATSWLLPWYLIWPLPLVAIARDRTLLALTLALTAFQLAARIPL